MSLKIMEQEPRYLLCRPHGGLNDTLCRIELCWKYAEQFGRNLIIDTKKSSLFGDFDTFFEVITNNSNIKVYPKLDSDLLDHLNTLDCNPSILTGKVDTYSAKFKSGVGYVEEQTGHPTRFGSQRLKGLDTDRSEPLLIYEAGGGGTVSQEFLNRIKFTQEVSLEITTAIQKLQRPYHAVHVRNTDYRTDYKKLFKKIKKKGGSQRLLVCSDDLDVITYANDYFSGEILFFPDRIRSMSPSGALHTYGSYSDDDTRRRAVIDSLIDLIALGCSNHLFISSIIGRGVASTLESKNQFKLYNKFSGFSNLALNLCQNQKTINHLLGLPDDWNNLHTKIVTKINHTPMIPRFRIYFMNLVIKWLRGLTS
jgi:hypothetical protein